ncbi:5-oxoproline transporter, DUF969 family subunit, partial [Kitasatospora sp. SC0581]|uniref:5-oxoproline transporter, DUF969 family subunit n=1 Tax=Kitasatospora sp. SC0581 TaxID=3394360 RepID=UPI003A8870C3
VLPVIGLLERYGLREQARNLIGRLGRLSAGRFLTVYLLVRQVTAAFGLNSIGGPAQTVRPLVAPMAEAAAVTRTGMAALLGGDPETTVPHLEKLGLTPANINGAGQIVAAGTAEQLAALAEDKPEGVRKVVALKVAGAFH